jgi:DNA-binding NtrC family response regulator
MKRILVVDESRVVRETLALILSRDFKVIQRSFLPEKEASFLEEKIDLLILGLSPQSAEDPFFPVDFVLRIPCAVLFLVDSTLLSPPKGSEGRVDCLAKPFNPYELREKIRRLMAWQNPPVAAGPLQLFSREKVEKFTRYLEFPYLSRTSSFLAQRYALSNLPVLIYGEMGCGQERVAKGMHELNKKSGTWIFSCPSEMTEERLLDRINLESHREKEHPQRVTLFLNGLDTLPPSAQSSLLHFMEREEEKGTEFWILSSSRVELLEKVYSGEFLDLLYDRLAALVLRLPPLRDRQEDLTTLATRIAQEYADRLDLDRVNLTEGALDRLRNYLWFGNLSEMETVIGRTLATHRKTRIEAQDLLFGFGEEKNLTLPLGSFSQDQLGTKAEGLHGQTKEKRLETLRRMYESELPDLKIFLYELAHELKNPMVAIKTFAKLLGERFDDVDFRTRFQETVNRDIERMDEVLEVLLEFGRFPDPLIERVRLDEELRQVLEVVVPAYIKRDAKIRWESNGEEREVFVDQAQFRYALKNMLLGVLNQVRARGEILIDTEKEDGIAISYIREGFFGGPFIDDQDPTVPIWKMENLPLRILLAKILLERNGGGLQINSLEGGKVEIKVGFREA